jgi:hypothetical protein
LNLFSDNATDPNVDSGGYSFSKGDNRADIDAYDPSARNNHALELLRGSSAIFCIE